MEDWTAFYAACSEMDQSAAMQGRLQPFNVQMCRVLISSDPEAAQSRVTPNFPSPELRSSKLSDLSCKKKLLLLQLRSES